MRTEAWGIFSENGKLLFEEEGEFRQTLIYQTRKEAREISNLVSPLDKEKICKVAILRLD